MGRDYLRKGGDFNHSSLLCNLKHTITIAVLLRGPVRFSLKANENRLAVVEAPVMID